MIFQITQATPLDINPLFEFFEKSLKTQFPEYSKNTIKFFLETDYSKTWLDSAVKNKSRVITIAKEEKGSIVGFLIGNKPYGGVSFCSWVAVDDNFQGKGIGSALLEEWEETAKKLGAHVVYLYSIEENTQFYKKKGYVLVGKIPRGYFGVEDYFLYKDLQTPIESNFFKKKT